MRESPALVESRRFGTRTVPVAAAAGLAGRRLARLRALPAARPAARRCCWPSSARALFWAARSQFWLLSGAFSGFLLVAPILATGLYAVSRSLQRSGRADLAVALRAWRPRDGRLVVFGVLLAFAGTGWVMTSASLITSLAPTPVRNPQDFVRVVLLADQGYLFEIWLALGGLLAAPVFASSVVAIPLLLDREVGVLAAVLHQLARGDGQPAADGTVGRPDHGPHAAGHGHADARAGGRGAVDRARQLARLPRPGRHLRPGRAALRPGRGMFGYTEEQIAWFGLTFGVSAFMLYMVFIILQLARESKAGKFGTFVLLLGLGVGLVGFAAKGLIKFFMSGIVE